MTTAGSPSTGSIVIPAWNEAGTIERTLTALFDGLGDDAGHPRVVVAANGCTDDTVERVRRLPYPVTLLDLPATGKTGALRAAEAATPDLPRIYLDADTLLPGPTANAVLATLRSGVLAARPAVRFDVDGASWPVRCFARARQRLPSVSADLCGAGVYGVSASGRARFGDLPDVLGDDLFVARHFAPEEIAVVAGAPVVVRLPRTVRSLVLTLRRVQRGNRELARLLPDRAGSTTATTARELVRSVHSVGSALDAAVYAALVAAGRVGSRRSGPQWERDETGRSS